ncbi:MAG: hypothetical protein D6734_05595 [Candidatus Schekmanbacteria bacterium]|nr:MAG: hypothetical protein D6734_05595 [Candidatus Schekmanbacteria bacterium]
MAVKKEELIENNTIIIECKRCNGKSPHKIRAVTEEKVKLHCEGCGKNCTRLIRRLLNEKEPSRRRNRRKISAERLSGIHLEESYLAQLQNGNPKPYAYEQTYFVDDIIEHHTFGLGKVVEQKGDNKIIVLFYKHGEKLLACSRTEKF